HGPAMQRLKTCRGWLHRSDALVATARQVMRVLVFEHLLDESVGSVSARHGMLADHVEEPGGVKAAAVVRKVPPEIKGERCMSHQPTLLGGEHRGEARIG